MGEQEIPYGEVLRAAEGFLRRFHDPFTRANLDDLAQEAAIETWRRGATLRDPSRAAAFARTVVRRLRYQAVQRNLRGRVFVSLQQEPDVADAVAARKSRPATRPAYRVRGEWVDARWLAAQVDGVLRGLGRLNRALVSEYYAGSTCRELGERYGIDQSCVKARLHRARLRIRETFLSRARGVGHVESAGCARPPIPTETGGEET